MKFRKKPVVIDAWHVANLLADAEHNWRGLPDPIKDAYERGQLLFKPEGIEVKTLEGWVNAGKCHFIIQGVKGELYPCEAEIFDRTYYPVDLAKERS